MTVPFSQFPANWKVPLYWVEVDPSMAGLPTLNQPVLLVGQFTSNGTAAPNIPIPVQSQAHATALFGPGSMLDRMFDAFFANNAASDMWALPIPDPSGVKANGTITVATAATGAGNIDLYIAAQKVPVTVAAADTTATIATNIAAAVNAMTSLPVTATVSTNVVTITCKWIGTTGNDIDMRDSFLGAIGGEILPAGVTLTYSGSGKLASGTGVPVFTTGIANLADEAYEYVGMPYTDSASISAWDAEFGFSDNGRWGWKRQAYGMVFSARRDTFTNLVTFGPTNNSPVITALAVEVGSPSSVWRWTAAYTAKAARALLDDPGRPLQTLTLAGILSSPKSARFSISNINTLTGLGLATQRVSPDGKTPMILRDTTMYQFNTFGQPDDAYEVVTTLATLARVIRNQRSAITNKFPRHKLADDGTRFGVGAAIVTPNIVKAELISEYANDEFNGLVQNTAGFKQNLIVERNTSDPNRLDVLYPPQLINQLRIFAVLAQFRLRDNPVTLTTA